MVVTDEWLPVGWMKDILAYLLALIVDNIPTVLGLSLQGGHPQQSLFTNVSSLRFTLVDLWCKMMCSKETN